VAVRPLAMGDQIANRLRLEVITGVIADGTHLAEDALAERFDVSRGPVRDALRQLEIEGLVENRRKRLYARVLGMTEIEELYAVRGALEGLAIELAMKRAADEDWTVVQDAVDSMRAAGERGDGEAFAHADMEFHTAFYDLSANRRLLEAWKPYQRTFSVLFELSDTPDIAAATRDHQELLDIVRSGRVEAAVPRLMDHLRSAEARIRVALGGRLEASRHLPAGV
jgi:GntR family transcriptional regulator, gluconate operon transcriptional repressor